jgi:hypothetical protein
VFGDGFTYTPVRTKPYEQSAKIGTQTSNLEFVNQDYKKVSGNVHVVTQLRYTSNKSLAIAWTIRQGGSVVASGASTSRATAIEFNADATKPVTLSVQYDEGGPTVLDVDTYLYDTVAY